MFQLSVRFSAEVEAQMTSVERLNDYSLLAPEDGYCCSNGFLQNSLSRIGSSQSNTLSSSNLSSSSRIRSNSTGTGSISSINEKLGFSNSNTVTNRSNRMKTILEDISTQVSDINSNHINTVLQLDSLTVSYRLDLEPVLIDLCLEIPSGYKVGICGRTGCGKSSLLLALLRLNLITSGDIALVTKHVDNIINTSTTNKNINTNTNNTNTNSSTNTTEHTSKQIISLVHDMDIETCRSLISVIPQDPHLFSGSVRYNLDPFQLYNDDEIWSALDDAHIKEYIHSIGGLTSTVEEQGKNFSVGLRKCKYILMDEVSASVDFVTDKLIQETIRTSPILKEATIITIAHRLRTIADSDLIVVINNGKVAESKHPYELLQEKSLFKQLVEQSNEYHDIYNIAENSYNSKK